MAAEAGDDVDDSVDSRAIQRGQLEESEQQAVSAWEGTKCNSEVKKYGLSPLRSVRFLLTNGTGPSLTDKSAVAR